MAKPPSSGAPGGDADPSMDDILASIRRILDEDQATKEPGADVLMLDPSMMLEDGGAKPTAATPETNEAIKQDPQPEIASSPPLVAKMETEHTDIVIDDPLPASLPVGRDMPAPPVMAALVAPEAAAAAANSVGALMRTLASERTSAVSRGGVTIEDIVREEIRPLLKAWLDTHLPSMVERLVRMEIERVVGRQTG